MGGQIEKMMLSKEFLVEKEHSALHVGSGTLEVLSTPSAIAMAENTCMTLSESLLEENETTVGSFIEFKHLKPSSIGANILVKSKIIDKDGKRINYSFELYDNEILIGVGRHNRVIVNKTNFL